MKCIRGKVLFFKTIGGHLLNSNVILFLGAGRQTEAASYIYCLVLCFIGTTLVVITPETDAK